MPLFQYSAADPSGKISHGALNAESKHELAAQLSAQGLFLVTCALQQDQPSPAESPTPVVAAETFRADASSSSARRTFTLRERALAALIIFAGVFIGSARLYHRKHPVENLTLFNEKLAKIHHLKDLSRANIEDILGAPYAPGEKPNDSRYLISPGMDIEIAYDRQGGPGSSQNHLDKTVGIRVLKIPAHP